MSASPGVPPDGDESTAAASIVDYPAIEEMDPSLGVPWENRDKETMDKLLHVE